MSDIDYDELDRAVNSLANQPVSGSSQLVTSSTTPQAAASSSPDNISSAPQANPDTQAVASRRSSGRFMDVVHPSSDMRPVTVPPRTTSREASPLQPPERAQVQPDVPAKDLQTPSLAEPTLPAAVDSPFLPDTKVEKRPLGAFANTEAPEPPTPDFSIKPVAEPDRPIESDTPLPRELQDDLLTVETNEEAPASQAVESEATTSKTNSAPIAPASILQQYVEKTDKVEPPTTSIFDVGNYQKTVGSKKKKKSGWLVVLWILLLIIAGAGAGAAVYFYVLPLL